MKAAFHTLGCKVNQYETESIKEQFKNKGYEIVSEDEFADIYVINTCTVTNLADRKSRQYIRRMKRVNPLSIVAVTGCYAQVNPEEVASIEGVDVVTGTDQKHNLINFIEGYMEDREKSCNILSYDELDNYRSQGINEFGDIRTRAYIKIQEGCNRFCSYCIIPYARGKVRSRSLDEIVEEAKNLVSNGYKEIVLTGINTALYGVDLGMGGIAPLIEKINAIEGDFRIRLSSLEPTVINREYVKKLFEFDKLCHHLHLSVQSGSDKILKSMNRRYTRAEYLNIIKELRNFDPNYGITTDIIVGFPGEEEEDFADSLKIVTESGYSKVHPFRYSKREGTPAEKFDNQIDGNIKNQRSKELVEISNKVAKEFFEKNIGCTTKVLFETYEDGLLRGYTDNYIYTYAKGDESMLNRLCKVKLKEVFEEGMKGEIVNV